MFATGGPPSAREAPIGMPPIFGIMFTWRTDAITSGKVFKGLKSKIHCLLARCVDISEIIAQV